MNKSRFLIVPLVLISFLTVIVTYKSFISMKDQMILLSEFNTNNFIAPLNKISQMNTFIPNISVTTIPLDHMKANYYINTNKIEKAKSLINE